MRRIGLAAAALAVVAVLLVLGGLAFLHLPAGERLLARLAGDGVAVEDLEVAWPFKVSARSVRLVDADGVWLRIEQPVIDWHPLALIRKILDIDRLAAARVVVERLPRPDPRATDAPGAKAFDPFAYRLELDRVEAPIIVEEPVLGERMELDLAGTFRMRRGGGEVDLHLRARHGEILRLAGTAGRDYLDLQWFLSVPRLARWERLAGVAMTGDLTSSGTIAGRLPHPAFTGTAQLGEGRVDGAAWHSAALSMRAVPKDTVWQTMVTVQVEAPAWQERGPLVPEARLEAVFDLDPDRGRMSVGSARLTAAGSELVTQGVVTDWGRHVELTVRTRVDDLSPLRSGLSGSARMTARVSGDPLRPDLLARLDVKTRGLGTGTSALDRLLGPEPQARVTASIRPGFQVTLHSAIVDGARADATLSGPVWPRLNAWARLAVPDLSVFTQTLAGAGVAQGRIAGPLDRLSTWGTAQVEGLAAAGLPAANGRVGFDFSDLIGTPAGTVAADLSILGHAVAGRARVEVAEDVRIDDLDVTSEGGRVTGSLVVADAGLRGRVVGTIPQLGAWRDLLPLDMGGSVRVDARLEPDRVWVEAEARTLAVADVTARTARLRAEVRLGGEVRARGVATAGGVAVRGVELDRVHAQAVGTPERFRFELDGQGPARASLAGSARMDGPHGRLNLNRLELSAAGVDLRLAGPTSILWGPDSVTAERTELAMANGGRLVIEGGVVGGRLSGRGRLDDVPLALLEHAVPNLDAVGDVDGTVTAGGTLASPRLQLRLRGTEVGFAGAAQAGIGRMTATLDADWVDGRLRASATAQDGARLRLVGSVSMPLRPGGGELLPVSTPLTGRLELAADLGQLTDTLPLAGHIFAGRIEGAATVAGTIGAPSFDGRVVVEGGRYENLELGTLVTGLSAVGRLSGDRISVEARGRDGAAGTARLDGSIDLDGRWQADLGLSGFRAVQRDEVKAQVTADLDLLGVGAEGRLSGRAAVESAEIDIGRLEGAGPVTLDVVELNRPGGDEEQSERPDDDTGPLTIALDVAVDIRRAFVRGRGLDSEWGGGLMVGGTLSDPNVTGRLVARQGRFEVFGRTFRLAEDSAVEFTGDGTDTTLDVAAEARAEEIVARVEVSGTPAAPNLDITSAPPLPRDEILSRVLFGSEAGKLSAFQQIQLGRMAATGLTGRGEGFDPIGTLRSALGLDVLEVGEAEEGGAALSAGKYIGEDTFLRVEQGTQGAGRVTVEQELGGGFSITTEVGQERGGGVGVEWRKDY